nr:hypothetical protein Itr_chr02CG04610 [Ipomoea trifida]
MAMEIHPPTRTLPADFLTGDPPIYAPAPPNTASATDAKATIIMILILLGAATIDVSKGGSDPHRKASPDAPAALNKLSDGHAASAGESAGEPRQDHVPLILFRRANSDHERRGGHQPVVGSEDRRAQPLTSLQLLYRILRILGTLRR